VTGGKRYLIFPELNSCCMCCTAEQGCGALRPDWLADAQFVGTTTLRGRAAWQWAKKGLQTNYYYSSADVAQVGGKRGGGGGGQKAPNGFFLNN
jgi:hypothetical protein